jgi:NADH-quinone oxidoreductase subunit N
MNFFEFYIIVLLSFFSLVLLVSSREIISFFFLLEIQGFSFYILASFKRNHRQSIESGIKYLILSSLSSILVLLGFSIIYGVSGLMDFTDLYYFFINYNSNTLLIFTAFLFIAAGFLFKLYHFPFHFWVSDIYQGSPLSSVSIFSTIPLLSIFYSFYVLIYYIFYNIISDIKYILFVLAIGTMIIGTLFALYQRKIKRLLAYSSITNIGYIMSSILNDNILGLHNGILFICIYIVNLLGIFIIFLNLFDKRKQLFLESFYSMSGFYKTHKNITIILIIYLFSLAGIPPFSSFFSKLFLITSLFNESFYTIVFVMIITTFLSAFYYVRIVKTFTYNESHDWYFIKPFSYLTSFTLVLLLFFQIYFGLYPSMLSSIIYDAILSFYL